LDGLRSIAILLVLLCHSIFDMHPKTVFGSHLQVIERLTWSGVDFGCLFSTPPCILLARSAAISS